MFLFQASLSLWRAMQRFVNSPQPRQDAETRKVSQNIQFVLMIIFFILMIIFFILMIIVYDNDVCW